jgi:response regulator RpfG family c-di-GMP phosphodiesterase
MEHKGRPKVLCVDDEPNVLEGLALHLRRRYDVTTANNGAAALKLITDGGSFAVVMSDMRMPGMDGAELLSRVREAAPHSVRILLTGQAEMKSAIAAINQGQIFRFLTKPCPPVDLLAAFDAALDQHRLITTERVLLEQTLRGSIKTLVDVLSLTSPAAFGRANRVKTRVVELAKKLAVADQWQVEVAAMLGELGAITLPPEVLERLHNGSALNEAEQKMVSRMPDVTDQLLQNIPRLEPVRAMLTRAANAVRHNEPLSDDPSLRTIELGARLLRIAVDFDVLEMQGHAPTLCIDTMRGRGDRYDNGMLEAFAALYGTSTVGQDMVRELPLAQLKAGMVFVEDLRLLNGALLCARGYEVNPSFLERARNFRPGSVKEPIRVLVRATSGTSGRFDLAAHSSS